MSLRAASCLLVGIAALSPALAAADNPKQACVTAYEQGQLLRKDGKLRAAGAQLLQCAQNTCPELVRRDCVKWLREVDDETPSLIVRARDPEGNDLTSVRVLLDGVLLLDRVDGKPVPADPGKHQLRFEREGAGAVEEQIVVDLGDKNRIVSATLSGPTAPRLPDSRATPGTAPEGARVPLGALVLGGLGVVAAGVATVFELKGLGDRQHLFGTCAGHCNPSDVDSAYRELSVGDVAAVVALAAVGGATWVFLANRSARAERPPTPLHVRVAPQPGGGAAILTGHF